MSVLSIVVQFNSFGAVVWAVGRVIIVTHEILFSVHCSN